MFRIVFLRAVKQAYDNGNITREQLRKARWSLLDAQACERLEVFAKQEVSDDEQGKQLLASQNPPLSPIEVFDDLDPIIAQRLFNAKWDWERLFDILVRLAPIIIAFL